MIIYINLPSSIAATISSGCVTFCSTISTSSLFSWTSLTSVAVFLGCSTVSFISDSIVETSQDTISDAATSEPSLTLAGSSTWLTMSGFPTTSVLVCWISSLSEDSLDADSPVLWNSDMTGCFVAKGSST